jgi:hypothetical protein
VEESIFVTIDADAIVSPNKGIGLAIRRRTNHSSSTNDIKNGKI